MYANFEDLKQRVSSAPRQRCVVAGADDEHAVEAAIAAEAAGFLTPVLVGPRAGIRSALAAVGGSTDYEIHDCPDGQNPAQIAVGLVREGEADFILKGRMQTADLLRPVLNKATGLNDSGFITHFGLMQIAGYHKLLAMSDSAVIPHPDLAQKRRIVEICVQILQSLGVSRPVVAALCAAETVSEKIPETLDAKALADAADAGEFGEAVVLGPISYDLATSREAAAIKGYSSPYAGDADLLLVPQMVTGNVMSKIWNTDDRNILAGCLVGARVPIALTSRSAGSIEKLHSLLLCSALSAASSTKTKESA